MTIGRICSREVDLADPDEPIQAAAERMAVRGVGSLVVIDARSIPIGILTDRDLALRAVGQGLDPSCAQVVDVMTPGPRLIDEDAPIEDALRIMRAAGVRRLPVVDARGKLAGVATLDDVLALIAEELELVGGLLTHGARGAALAR